MTHHQIHSKEFLVGAVVGSLLGTGAALLMAPKSGEKLRRDIFDTYEDLSDKSHDLARKGRCLAKNVGSHTRDWSDKAKSIIDRAKGLFVEEEVEEGRSRDLLVGGLVGGILGAIAGLLIAPKPGSELRQDLIDTYEDVTERTQDIAADVSKKGRAFAKRARSKANRWLDLAKDVVDELTEDVQETKEDWSERVKKIIDNNRVNDALEWASLGFRLLQGIKSKR